MVGGRRIGDATGLLAHKLVKRGKCATVPRNRRIRGILHANSPRRASTSTTVPLNVSPTFWMATTTLPSGWSLLATRTREDLHQALLTCTCQRAFADVPVDWWDESADVWRPTSIIRVLGEVWDVRRDVEVLVPGAEGTSPRRVSIAHVRLSRLLTAGVSRYWAARYQRLLVLRLIERTNVPDAELELAAAPRRAPSPRGSARLRRVGHRIPRGRTGRPSLCPRGAADR